MYLKYKHLPEFNRICIKASRDRAYQQHMDCLKRMHPCVDTTEPPIPQTVGRNYKRYENEQVRNEVITRDNRRLLGKMNDIQRQEHYPRAVPQRPYTLMGQAQKDEMWRITHENHKLLTAVQERRPILNRNDWLHHKLDHTYQITKMSEYLTTVPMGEIIREEQVRTSHGSRPGTTDDAPPPQEEAGEQEAEGGRESSAPETLPDVIGDTAGSKPLSTGGDSGSTGGDSAGKAPSKSPSRASVSGSGSAASNGKTPQKVTGKTGDSGSGSGTGAKPKDGAIPDVIADTVGANPSSGSDPPVRDLIHDGISGNVTKDDPPSDPGALPADPIKAAVTAPKEPSPQLEDIVGGALSPGKK
jgi:hypothetical protein